MVRANNTLSAWKRRRRAQRHALLAAAHERALRADLEKVLKRIARSASKLVGQGLNDQAVRLPDAYRSQLTRLFEGRLEAAALAQARLVIDELTGEKAESGIERKFLSLFDVAQAAIRTWITSYAAAKVVRILETTRMRIRKSIERGEEQNEPPRVLARRIVEETGGEIARRRAETIARTESLTAASVGSDEAAKATGLQLDKQWTSAEDLRVRPDHAKADGQVVAMDAMFDVGGVRMKFPRDPNGPASQVINCRCVCLYVPRLPKPAQQKPPAPPPAPTPFAAKPKAERVLHEKFFKDAPDHLKEVIRTTRDTVAVKNRKGAHANWNNGTITMNSAEKPGEYGVTWRHEFGHHIDFTRGVASKASTKEMAADRAEIVASSKTAVSSRPFAENAIERHDEELSNLSGSEQKRAIAELCKGDMLTADVLEKFGRPLNSAGGAIMALRLHYYEQAQDWDRYLRAVYNAQIDDEAKTLALMAADYVSATTKAEIAFGHPQSYYDRSQLIADGIRQAQVLEAFANHIAITGSRPELASIFGKIVQRIAPQTWAKMQEIADGLV